MQHTNSNTKQFLTNGRRQCILSSVSHQVWAKSWAAGENARDSEFALSIRMIPPLAFVPLASVSKAFKDIQESITHDYVQLVLEYFEDNYMGQMRRNSRARPTFNMKVWNVYSRVHTELPRTNNSAEGRNRKLQAAVTALQQLNLWRFRKISRESKVSTTVLLTRSLVVMLCKDQRRNIETVRHKF